MGLSFLILILPKIGHLSILKVKVPNEEARAVFYSSFQEIVKQYKFCLDQLHSQPANFANINWDTGAPTEPGEYEMADIAYCNWLQKLEKKEFQGVTPEIKKVLTDYFSDKNQLREPLQKKRTWRKTSEALTRLANAVAKEHKPKELQK